MFNYPKEQSFEQGLKDAINKLTNQLEDVQKDPYKFRQVHTRIQDCCTHFLKILL